jgi:hypothetical protein
MYRSLMAAERVQEFQSPGIFGPCRLHMPSRDGRRANLRLSTMAWWPASVSANLCSRRCTTRGPVNHSFRSALTVSIEVGETA